MAFERYAEKGSPVCPPSGTTVKEPSNSCGSLGKPIPEKEQI